MFKIQLHPRILAGLIIVLMVTGVRAQPYDLNWNSIDCGGGISSTGGNFELGGTFGQPDAGPKLTGGNYQLAGGFWPAFTAPHCPLRGDLNSDGRRDGQDIQMFIGCYLGDGINCACADMDQDEALTPADVNAFANVLLAQ